MSGRLRRLKGVQTARRNGLHRSSNQDHSMLTGMPAARNLTDGDRDAWEVNIERSHHEDVTVWRRA